LREEWCLPTVNAEFVYRMEDVLDLYAEPHDPRRPLVCFDERPCQLISEIRRVVPAKPGQPERHDYEYKREGTCNLFLFFAPGEGWRHIEITQRRTARDFAQCMKELVDEHFADAQVIRVVLDNLNIHTPASLYEIFAPAEARRIARKLEFHFTPKHGSWLNMAEIEFAALAKQCLGRRIPSMDTMRCETTAWEDERNAQRATVHWRFTTSDARIKLNRLYPS
jgi:transposase